MEVSTAGVNLTGSPTVNSVAIANTTQVAAKQDTLVSGTNIKTVNSTTILGSGNLAVQDVLVSGTNIKTINGTSLLGSGNIPVVTSPSGVSGAIQFSNGSAFASDAANLFWDDTNNRLGVGTNTPTRNLQVNGIGAFINSDGNTALYATNSNTGVSSVLHANCGSANMYFGGFGLLTNSDSTFGQLTTLGARVGIKGSGTTSGTTSLLVQNSAGTATLTARDDGKILIRDYISGVGENAYLRLNNSNGFEGGYNEGSGGSFQAGGSTVNLNIGGSKILQGYSGGISIGKGASNPVASAQLEVFSTTKGFLPPVMTTTQRNAIASPATGLVVYDSTTNKLCCYNGSTWNDLF
jgi:hypothetical protein